MIKIVIIINKSYYITLKSANEDRFFISLKVPNKYYNSYSVLEKSMHVI